MPLLYHFAAGPSVVNPEFLDRIDFYPGGFGAEYGRAIGGIVDVKTRSPKEASGTAPERSTSSTPACSSARPCRRARRERGRAPQLRRRDLRTVLPLVTNSGVLVAPSYYDYQARVD